MLLKVNDELCVKYEAEVLAKLEGEPEFGEQAWFFLGQRCVEVSKATLDEGKFRLRFTDQKEARFRFTVSQAKTDKTLILNNVAFGEVVPRPALQGWKPWADRHKDSIAVGLMTSAAVAVVVAIVASIF